VPIPFGHAAPQGEDTPDDDDPPGDQVAVWAWRLAQASELGYRPAECEQIAAADFSLHDLRILIAEGCEPLVAIRILL
jgi:hypothetical protein